MIKYNFQIKKEACFAYWAQSLVKWIWYYHEDDLEHTLKLLGRNFTEKEKKALERLKTLLQKDGYGYSWLWDRYSGKEIKNKKNLKIWRGVIKDLNDAFKKVWQSEYPKLLSWKKNLQKYPFNKLNDNFFNKVSNFFEVDINSQKPITVNLLVGFDKITPGAHVKQEFDNFLIMSLSNIDSEFLNNIIGVLSHETVHLFDYASDKMLLRKKSYEEIILPTSQLKKFNKILKKDNGPHWKHLLTEAIITSIANAPTRYSYLQSKLFKNSRMVKEEKKLLNNFDFKKNQTNYGYQIRVVAAQLTDTTIKYLDNNLSMDKKFTNKVARIWLRLIA